MPLAVILLTVEGKETHRIAESIASLPGITEVYSVAGTYDLVAIARVSASEELADLVTDHLRATPGVKATETLIAFRVYAPKDVQAMFDLD